MFPLWDRVIAPVMDAVSPTRVIEIGALRGETTALMLERLGPDCELHVIDPVPQFDPAEHERRFPGRYVFHLGVSHDVLPELAPADVALVDGDHNWFTVYHELRMLAQTSRDAGVPLPVLILHDVGWPYGRRDLYYEPGRIPDEHRQPYQVAGMRPGKSELVHGGMNRDLANADHEGGPRNGVFTALEDFIAEHDEAVRLLVLPAYYGLAIAVEETVLADQPALAALLDRWASEEGARELVDVLEGIRVGEAMFTQAWVRALEEKIGRGAARFLGVVKAALLDEHYLDHEVRIAYLARLLGSSETPPDLSPLRDPSRALRADHARIAQARQDGRVVDGQQSISHFPYADMGRAQLDHLEASLDRVRADGVEGGFAEIGVGRGGGAIFIRAYLAAHELTDRKVWVVDEFVQAASDPADAVRAVSADLNQVRDGFARFDLLDDTVRFLQGDPARLLAEADYGELALVRFGPRAGPELTSTIEAIHPHLADGAIVVVSGTSDPRVMDEVVSARAALGIEAPLEDVDWNAVSWTSAGSAARVEPVSTAPAVFPVQPDGAVDLSVVVVMHDMQREAQRTLRSLSRSYQHSLDDVSYEVLVVDNGSSQSQRLTAEQVQSFGTEFHLVDMGPEAGPSPTRALNTGARAARGRNLALMIDGAHVLTPGVLHNGLLALATYEPAVVATQQWYVGPGQQNEMLHEGYDQAVEDRLFDRIHWPVDGYRLFDVGHFIGERDWFDGIMESNCLFVPKTLFDQVGGFDDAFSMPGGGYANLDIFERLALTPGVNVASILGEGSFHQFHGGTTTNVPDVSEHRDRVASYGAHFAELRGRPLLGLDRAVHFVGSLARQPTRRTRSRRYIEASRRTLADPVAHDAGQSGSPVADELKLAAIEASWDQGSWRSATWLGHPVFRHPADLHCYQELFVASRPEVVVVTGDDPGLGGRALMFASIADAIGSGRVVAIGTGSDLVMPEHPRIDHVDGSADDEGVAQESVGLVADDSAMVLLGLGPRRRVIEAFEHYEPLVQVGGSVVVENTVVNGRPAAPGFGPGPLEAVFAILSAHPDFVTDRSVERYTLTFNRGGYLRRMAPK